MVYDGKDYLLEIVAIFGFLSLILIVLFCVFYGVAGVFLVLALFGYVMFFIYRDRKMKKEELNHLLEYDNYWIKRNILHVQLSNEIP